MEQYGASYGASSLPRREHFEDFSPPDFYGADGSRPYPFAGTVLMGALLNIAIFKLSPRTNAAHFVAIGVLGSLGVNCMHAILKLAGHTKNPHHMTVFDEEEEDFSHLDRERERSPSSLPPSSQHTLFTRAPVLSEFPMAHGVGQRKEVYDSNIRFIHIVIVKPLSGLSEMLIPWFTATKGIRDVASGVFHHIGPQYTYQDGRRDIQLVLAGVVAAFALKKIAPWFKPSLNTDWQTVAIAVLLPAIWTKATQLPLAKNGDPGKPWSWGQNIVERVSKSYAEAASTRGTGFRRK
ncbi:MAG: hypothetical protein H7A41_06785 [Chlamydiales bacterium]|nr:hypothetical protein [Chlamydiales bacterium]